MNGGGRHGILAAIGVAAAFLSYLSLLGPRPLVQLVGGREMLVENLGALAYLGASIVFFLLYRDERGRVGAWRKVQVLGLSAFFFVAFGEEISWGQQWLHFETPEPVRELNAQEETNLHNLWMIDSYDEEGRKKEGLAAFLLNSNRIFDYCMVGLFGLLPLARRLRTPFRPWLERLGTPVPATIFAGLLALDFGLSFWAERWVVDGMFRHLATSEIREYNYGVIAFLAAWELWRRPASGAAEPARTSI